jgi:hypothetical protein
MVWSVDIEKGLNWKPADVLLNVFLVSNVIIPLDNVKLARRSYVVEVPPSHFSFRRENIDFQVVLFRSVSLFRLSIGGVFFECSPIIPLCVCYSIWCFHGGSCYRHWKHGSCISSRAWYWLRFLIGICSFHLGCVVSREVFSVFGSLVFM